MTEPSNPLQLFHQTLQSIFEEYRPSKHPFFEALAKLSPERARSPKLLGELYLRYQAAMHSTRVMVYRLPFLDNPSLRIRKLQIYIDDDGLAGGDTHHHQLSRAFRRLGAELPIEDEEFGDLGLLQKRLDPETASFVAQVEELYERSLGPWCIVEKLSDDWMRSLAAALGVHFPQLKEEPYFADCFRDHVEERHGQEAFEITEMILLKRPELLDLTLSDARAMASALNQLWSGLAEALQN